MGSSERGFGNSRHYFFSRLLYWQLDFKSHMGVKRVYYDWDDINKLLDIIHEQCKEEIDYVISVLEEFIA